MQAYHRLADIWQQISEEESNPNLKVCYAQKTDNYHMQIQKKEASAVSDIGMTVSKFKQL